MSAEGGPCGPGSREEGRGGGVPNLREAKGQGPRPPPVGNERRGGGVLYQGEERPQPPGDVRRRLTARVRWAADFTGLTAPRSRDTGRGRAPYSEPRRPGRQSAGPKAAAIASPGRREPEPHRGHPYFRLLCPPGERGARRGRGRRQSGRACAPPGGGPPPCAGGGRRRRRGAGPAVRTWCSAGFSFQWVSRLRIP